MKGTLQKLVNRYFSGRRVSPRALKHMRDSLLDESLTERNYIVLIIGSCIIATLGLLANSAAVIIGAMLVAPLMQPIRGIAFGILEGDAELIQTGLRALSWGSLLAVGLSTLIGLSIDLPGYGSEVLSRSQPNLLDLGIAVTAGGISGFAKVEPKISNTLAGTAIAVALMPPICVVGLGLAQWEMGLTTGSLLLYLTNLLGITLACMLAFWLAGYSPFQRASRPLGWTMAITSLLVLPLGYSSVELLRQNRLEAHVKDILLGGTLTFQRLQLIRMDTDWLVEPPEVTLVVYARDPVTPKQVQLVEAYLTQRMRQPFRLIFEVSQVEAITRDSQALPQDWQDNSPALQPPEPRQPVTTPAMPPETGPDSSATSAPRPSTPTATGSSTPATASTPAAPDQ
ncbi:hypothetical protein XM38_038690 [Halomicronema hongdechloris C2206]|uniref:TIGR00341 family protein n=1 Tax=Halomicronema hongdechloris C2206 TaxID=1641165 RepID=A0A1Z3HRF6_9CYAN|nr:TIGR00341 family protein [Halomicronema hongdechloris]ASC72909.1 hypothetical protein XM38_038690 [Halomicronema hongdechloris C2206]